MLVFLIACFIIAVGWRLVGENVLARQAVVWVANVSMLIVIWMGLRFRGQSWEHFGLGFGFPGWRTLLGNVIKSIVVFVFAVSAFILSALLVPKPESGPQQADMSSYEWLRGSLPMLLLALLAVYLVSSFGEEVVYRGFLINRLAELGNGGTIAYGIAVVASSVVFGLVHFSWGLVGIVQTTFMGVSLAISYLLVKRLSVLVLAHCYLDTLLLVQIYLS
ncbi:MAG: hypothetical protein Tsb009_26570 [Planctomycetaceae bacterium]